MSQTPSHPAPQVSRRAISTDVLAPQNQTQQQSPDYRGYLMELNRKCDALLASRLVKSPIGTIATAMIVAMLLWTILVAVVVFALGGMFSSSVR